MNRKRNTTSLELDATTAYLLARLAEMWGMLAGRGHSPRCGAGEW